jgi:hypothetical protein
MERLPVKGRPRRLVPALIRTIASLNNSIDARNELVRLFASCESGITEEWTQAPSTDAIAKMLKCSRLVIDANMYAPAQFLPLARLSASAMSVYRG